MACPGDDVLVAMIEKALDPAQLGDIEVHLDSCESCREVVAVALGSQQVGVGATLLAEGTPTSEPGADPEGLIGSTLGNRYRVSSVLGRGGMGTVYLARDVTLDRDVAVKVHRSGSGKDRLQREAVVMAQLAHPNVVNVFEVGTVDNWMYVAMEYVRGSTLREWIATPREWRSVVALLLEAGAGLAAAHAAGLVHRDFKPENVLVGSDGRPRVSDFGLARVDREPNVPSSAASSASLDVALTIEGTVLGTPAYMAPEQFSGTTVDARADQFAFAVVAWECLYQQRPFAGTTIEAVQTAIEEHTITRTNMPAIPERVRRVLERGLSADAGARYADMPELLGELRRAAAPRTKRRVAIGVATAAIILGAALPVGGTVLERRRLAKCDDEAATTIGVFGVTQHAVMYARFVKAGGPAAGEAFDRTARVLDRQAEALGTQVGAACRAQVAPARRECLTERTEEFASLVSTMSRADKGLVMRAPDAAWSSLDPTPCDDANLPAINPKETPAQRARFAETRALNHAGKYEEAVKLGTSLVDEARASKDSTLELMALLAVGSASQQIAAPADVLPMYHQAEALAETLGRDGDVVAALGAQVSLASELRDFPGARRALALARAKLSRIGGGNTLNEAKLDLMEAELLAGELKYAESEAAQRKAIATLETVLGADHPTVGSAYGTLSQLLLAEDKTAESATAIRHAMDVLQRALGPSHPTAAGARMTLGVTLISLGQLDEARALLLEADVVISRTFGKKHPVRTGIVGRIARIERTQGHLDKALVAFRETLALSDGSEGPDSLLSAGVRMDIAVTLAAQHQYAPAEAEALRGLAITEAIKPPDFMRISSALVDVATIQLAGGHPARAIPTAERALREIAKQKEELNKSEQSAVQFVLAQALWDTKGDRTRAKNLAAQALAGVGDDAEARTKIQTWIAAHAT